MRVLFRIFVIGVLVALGSCKKHQPTVKYVTDPLIYDYLMKYDKGSYWVMETTHKDSTITEDTIFVKDAKCTLTIHTVSGCADDEPKTCDYDEVLQSYLESPTISCYLPLSSSSYGIKIGCGFINASSNFFSLENGSLTSPSGEIARRIFFLSDSLIGNELHENIYRVQIYDCRNKKYGRVYFTREKGFILWVFDDFTARLKSSKIILRQNLCRNNPIK